MAEGNETEKEKRSLTFHPTLSAAAATTTNARTNTNAHRRHYHQRFAPPEEVGGQAPDHLATLATQLPTTLVLFLKCLLD